MPTRRPVKVVRVSLDEPLRPIAVEERYGRVLLVVTAGGTVVGQVRVPALSVLSPDLVRSLVARHCGEALWRRRLAGTFLTAARGVDPRPAVPPPAPSVSVVICTRDRADQLAACLESLLALEPPPHEIVVVDNAPSDDATERLCAGLPVRYVREDHAGLSRARNRGLAETTGDLVAFTDDDCTADRSWLAELGGAFADPLVACVTGYVGPVELETPSQVIFEQHGGFSRGHAAQLFDGAALSPMRQAVQAGAGANMVLRRSALAATGVFAEELGAGTPTGGAEETELFYRLLATGHRIAFDPSRIVWHRHRGDLAGLRRLLSAYGAAVVALCVTALGRHREPAAFRVLWWWWRVQLAGDLWRIVRRDRRRLPVRLFLAELGGTLAGPWRLVRSRRARRRLAPIALPAPATPPLPAIRIAADAPALSVVIPAHDRRDLLVRVLQGLAAQTYPADRFEAVVVLDACTDGSAEAVRALELPFRLTLLEHDARNAAASRNRGVREARHPVAVLLDDDTVPESEALAAHAESHRLAPAAQAALGTCPPWIDRHDPWALAVRAWWEDYYRRRGQAGHRWSYADFASANASLTRELLLAHPYDESFPTRREDWDLGLRLLHAGVAFAACPAARAWHHLDTTFATALRHRRADGHADAVLALKHPAAQHRLPLAAFLGGTDEAWLDERMADACAGRGAAERRLRRGQRRVERLAALRLRGRWRRQASALFREAYVLGLADALGAPQRLHALAAAARAGDDAVAVSLDEPTPFGVPRAPDALELEVALGGGPVGRVVALEPGAQWDWDVAARRVVDRLGPALREQVVLEELARARRPRPPRTVPSGEVVRGA